MTKQILIIEDNKAISEMLLFFLMAEMPDYTFLFAENGLEGLNILGEREIDLTVTDLNMPVMDGYEFLSQARKAFPEMPIFVMTAEDNSVEKRVFAFGVSKVYYKPLDFIEVSKDIRMRSIMSRRHIRTLR